MKFLVAFMVACVLLSGCQSGACIKVGGTYKDSGGEIQYCFGQAQSDAAGVPAFEATNEAGETETLFGLDEETIEKIKDKIKELTGMDASAIKQGEEEHPVKAVLRMIEK
jgi:hypothetical protein